MSDQIPFKFGPGTRMKMTLSGLPSDGRWRYIRSCCDMFHKDERKDEDPRHAWDMRDSVYCNRCHKWAQGYGAPDESTIEHAVICSGERRKRETWRAAGRTDE